MSTTDLVLFGTTFGGTLALAAILRVALAGRQDHEPPYLDGRGLLLFVPLITLFVMGAPADAMIPMLAAVVVFHLAMLSKVMHLARWLRVVLVLVTAAVLYHSGGGRSGGIDRK